MKSILLGFLLLLGTTLYAQTDLDDGDIAFLYLNGEANSESFAFVLTTAVTAGTQIVFTNNTWTGAQFCDPAIDNSVYITWTASADLPAGTIIQIGREGQNDNTRILNDQTSLLGSVSVSPAGGEFLFRQFQGNQNGSMIYAFQGSSTSPDFISAIGNYVEPTVTGAATCGNFTFTLDGTGLDVGIDAINFAEPQENHFAVNCSLWALPNAGDFYNPAVLNTYLFDPAYWSTPSSNSNVFSANGQTIYPCGPNYVILPVRFQTELAGRMANSNTDLFWATAYENNTSHFEIERGSNPRDFRYVGRVQAANVANGQRYTFTDVNPPTGKLFYRLKVVDQDGTVSYSNVALVNNKAGIVIDLFPNPTSGKLTLSVPYTRERGQVTVYGLNGQRWKQWNLQAEETRKELNLDGLPAGLYIVEYRSGTESYRAKVIKQ